MSPNQLIPSQPYTLSYYITDHTDSSTYYVRAVVYDASTGEVLDTQNLTRQTTNTHLFSKVVQAPGDSSGRGRRIVVVATAYTDSGYTIKADNYQQQMENYIVIKAGANGVLGGGFGVDYNLVKEIVVEQIDKVLKTLTVLKKAIEVLAKAVAKIPTDETDLKPLVNALGEVQKQVALIPLDNSVDLAPVIAEIGRAIEVVIAKPVTDATDIAPLTEALNELKDEINLNHDEHKSLLGTHMADLHTVLPGMIHDNSKSAIEATPFSVTVGKPEKKVEKVVEKPVGVPFDIKTLTGQQ